MQKITYIFAGRGDRKEEKKNIKKGASRNIFPKLSNHYTYFIYGYLVYMITPFRTQFTPIFVFCIYIENIRCLKEEKLLLLPLVQPLNH